MEVPLLKWKSDKVLSKEKCVRLLLFSVVMDCYETSIQCEFSLVGVMFMLLAEVIEKECFLSKSLSFHLGLKFSYFLYISLP